MHGKPTLFLFLLKNSPTHYHIFLSSAINKQSNCSPDRQHRSSSSSSTRMLKVTYICCVLPFDVHLAPTTAQTSPDENSESFRLLGDCYVILTLLSSHLRGSRTGQDHRTTPIRPPASTYRPTPPPVPLCTRHGPLCVPPTDFLDGYVAVATFMLRTGYPQARKAANVYFICKN